MHQSGCKDQNRVFDQSRLARVVVPGVAHHVTQRGNRRQDVFFEEDDYRCYLDLASEWCGRYGIEVWAYCLMTNHIHLIAVPETPEGLQAAFQELHQRYARRINFKKGWRGYLWQGRFASYPMDDAHLLMAARYVELNPVRAKLANNPEDYRWSSAQAHLKGENDALVIVSSLLERVEVWQEFLERDDSRFAPFFGHFFELVACGGKSLALYLPEVPI